MNNLGIFFVNKINKAKSVMEVMKIMDDVADDRYLIGLNDFNEIYAISNDKVQNLVTPN